MNIYYQVKGFFTSKGKKFYPPFFALAIMLVKITIRADAASVKVQGEVAWEEIMPKKALWLIIIFTLLFILGINTGDLEYLMNLGNTICLSCIGVG